MDERDWLVKIGAAPRTRTYGISTDVMADLRADARTTDRRSLALLMDDAADVIEDLLARIAKLEGSQLDTGNLSGIGG